MARDTLRSFQDYDIIVTPAPSCVVAMGHEYERLLADDPEWLPVAEAVAPKVHDLVTFLEARLEQLRFKADTAGQTVTVHRFCQSGNILGHTDEMDRLLRAAGVAVVAQSEPDVCCGFGGSTSVTSPHTSQAISARKLASLQAAGVATVVTDNPGCVLHLRGVADAAGVDLEVVHPAEILRDLLQQG